MVHLGQGRMDRSEAGLTLVEVLISLLIIFIIAAGLMPMFVQAIRSNESGKDSSTATNHARSQLETLLQLDFNDARLIIPGGDTQLTTDEYWDSATRRWLPGAPPAGTITPWTRTTRIQQFSIGDLEDNGILNSPLNGGTPALQVHLKEIQVTVVSQKPLVFSLGTPADVTIMALKPI